MSITHSMFDHAFNEVQAAEQVLVITNTDLHAAVGRKATELASKASSPAQSRGEEATGATPKRSPEQSPD
jgi:hypothetical protein